MKPSGSGSETMKNNSRAGFTLIEVVAGLFITGLFMIVVMPFITQLVSSAWSGERSMTTADQWMRANARLSDDFAEARPLLSKAGSHTLIFEASSQRVKFVRRSLTGDHNVLELTTLSIEQNSDGESLIRSSQPFEQMTDDEQDGDITKISLLSTSCDLRFTIPDQSVDENAKRVLPREIMLNADNCAESQFPLVFPIAARDDPLASVDQIIQK